MKKIKSKTVRDYVMNDMVQKFVIVSQRVNLKKKNYSV